MTRTAIALALMVCGLPATARIISVTPGPNDQETLQSALIEAAPGDTVMLQSGTYRLQGGLSLDVDNVTVKGAGPDKSVLSFKGQSGAGEGLLVTSDRVLLTGFAVEDTRGDGIKAKGVDRITFHDLRVEWTNGPDAKNGAYGLYPVESSNILIEKSAVFACSDAGIYVGQSKNIVVRNNRVEFNVAGIEIENSMHADVHDNLATRNTGGILVFDLPDIPQVGGHSTRVFRNRIFANDTPNFAAKGNIVESVPMGAGLMVMATKNVHVFDNEFADNATAHVLVVAYPREIKDARYNPLPRDVFIGANSFGRGGWAPDFPGGKALAAAAGGSLPPVVWDGAERWTAAGEAKAEPVKLAFVGGGALSFGLASAGGELAQARPAPVTLATTAPAPIAPVVLPADQPKP